MNYEFKKSFSSLFTNKGLHIIAITCLLLSAQADLLAQGSNQVNLKIGEINSVEETFFLREGQTSAINYQENFDNASLFSTNEWERFQEVGQQNWTITDNNSKDGDPYSARMNGFAGSSQENRTWLISPVIETTSLATDEFLVMQFEARSFFADGTPLLRVFVSTDYDRSTDPTNSQFSWVEVFPSLPSETGVWENTGEIDLTSFAGNNQISIAIVYESFAEPDGAAEWLVDNFELYSTATAPAPIVSTSDYVLEDFYFGILEPGSSSDPRSISVSASNLQAPLVLTGDPGIEMSIGNDFSSQLSLNQTDFPSEGPLTVQTRMTASSDESVLAQAGRIDFSTEGLESREYGYFNQTSVGKDATFDIVTWNIEWFGDPANATTPSADLQRQRVRQMIEELDADVYAFQEITSIPSWNLLLLELEDYEGVLSPAYSSPAGSFDDAQKLAFLYKKATVDTLRTKVLLDNIDTDLLKDFPANNKGLFWSSGRLPFAMDISSTINGIRRDLSLINIHARSNGGGESANFPRYKLRRYDVEVLYDTIQQYYADKSVILIGDYNDDILKTVAETDAPTVPESGESSYIKFISDSTNYLGVSMPLSKAGLRSFVTEENVIDHITINNNLFEDHILGAERVVIPYATIPDYNSTASDHLPVEARFLLAGEPVISSIAEPESDVLVYPNPTDGKVKFKSTSSIERVELLNINGTTLMSFEDTTEIDLSAYQSGLYLLKIKSRSGLEIKRILLK